MYFFKTGLSCPASSRCLVDAPCDKWVKHFVKSTHSVVKNSMSKCT